jgi:hypothetical protein
VRRVTARPITIRTRPHRLSALIDARLCRITVTTVVTVALLFCMLRWLLDRRRIRREGMLKELSTADLATEDGEELVQRMFIEFDEDASGRISIFEAAKFMRVWQPTLSKKTAYKTARDYASDGSLGFGLFLQLLVEQKILLDLGRGDQGIEDKGSSLSKRVRASISGLAASSSQVVVEASE